MTFLTNIKLMLIQSLSTVFIYILVLHSEEVNRILLASRYIILKN